MKKMIMILSVLIVAAGLCSCGLKDAYTEMGFGFEAEGKTVITYFADEIVSETGGFTFYNESPEPVDVHINACDGTEKITIEDLKEGPVWQRVDKNKEYAIGFSTDAPEGTEMSITIIDGDEVKAPFDAADAAVPNPLHIERHLAAAVGGDGPLVDEAIIYIDDASCVQNGIRVTAKQAVADQHNLYVLLQVNSKRNIEFTFHDRFTEASTGVKGAWTGTNLYWHSASKDGEVLYVVLGLDAEERLDKGTVVVSLRDFVNINEGETIYRGNWHLEFDFEVADVTKEFEPAAVIHHNGIELKLNQLDVSPFAVYMSCGLADESEKPDDEWDLYGIEVDFIMENGETVNTVFDSGGTRDEGDWSKFMCYRHGKLMDVIDPQDVQAVSINGQVIELE